MKKTLVRIAVTGGAGQIAYNLLFRIASGEMLGKDQPIALHILELPEILKQLEGIKMELEDCAFPLLREIHIGSDPLELFKGVHYALLIGAKPRGSGMERKDLLQENGRIFIPQGKALNACADPNVKVLVVGNPCNTNCLIAMNHAPNIPRKNFYAMMRLDHNRALAQLALKTHTNVADISHLTIWGNHSSTQVPDASYARIKGRPVNELLDDPYWLEKEFMTTVQTRGAAIIAARGKSSAASAASAVINAIQDIIKPTTPGEWFSSAVCSDGNPYGIAENLIFSFPCHSKGDGEHEIFKGLIPNEFYLKKIKESELELIEERRLALDHYKE